ncbi:mitochondrial uncoupling protein 3 [Selaginella moellendorffii]|nr:mitochondrial uncoupling protein 3 [Selaginella moellendorffii]|eukprot:XP_002990780.2 mitochondrial uncoupling protein 3 [Selaginella moellendorffii]
MRLALTAASAIAAESATFPIDITKTRLQLQGEGSSIARGCNAGHRGAFGTVYGIAREEGLRGLYRGLSPALLRHVFYTSIRIVSYEQLRSFSSSSDQNQAFSSLAEKAVIGGASGIIGQVVASPADLIKVRMQADGRLVKLGHAPRYTSVADAFHKIMASEGVLGLWRGVGPNAQRAFLVNMGELACYDQAKHKIIQNGVCGDNVVAHTLASLLSGLSATLLSCPADVVKTRMMNQAGQSYRSSLDCLAKTVTSEGVTALWKGFFPTWARLGPWQFVFWVSYEQLRRFAGLSSF